MINNDSVRQALGTLERFAPAEDEVLAGLRTGIVRRRKRRQVASVVGVAGAAGMVALGVVYVAPGRGGDGGTPPAATAGTTPTTSVKIATPPAAPVLPFTVGWTPEGYSSQIWEAGRTDGSVQYTGTKDFQAVVVWISAKPRPAAQDGDSEEPTTVAGRTGVIRRLAPDSKETQFIWQLDDGRWAMVGGRAPTVQLATLRRVAESVTTKPTPLTAPFSLTTLPDGYQVASWSGGSDQPFSGSLTICRTVSEPLAGTLAPDCIGVSLHDGTAPAVTLRKDSSLKNPQEIPMDREQVIDGVLTRAPADGTEAVAQVDAGHWASAVSQAAGVDLLRQVVASVRS